MKKIFVLIMAVVLCSANVIAQEDHWSENRHSLSISGGYVSTFFLAKSLVAWIPMAAGHSRNAYYFGNYGIQYHYQLNRWCRIGAKGIWEGDNYDFYTGSDATDVKKGVTFDHTVSLLASVQFTYFNHPHVQLYSGFDLGVGAFILDTRYEAGFSDSDGKTHPIDVTWMPSFDITPIGVAFGCWRVYGFVETNIGFESFVKAGLGVHI